MNQSIQPPDSDDQFDEALWSIPVTSARDLLDLSDRSLEFLANLNEVLERLLPEQFPPDSSDEALSPSNTSLEQQNRHEPSETRTHGTTPPHPDH